MRTIAVFAMLAAGPLWPSAFTIANLGSLGGTTAVGFRINNSGITIGWATTAANDTHAFQPGAGDLTPVGTSEAFAYGINSSGLTVGTSYIAGQAHGTVWSGGGVTDLGAGTFGLAVNDAGAVAGGNGHAFILANGQLHDLGTLPGGSWSAAYALNATGSAAGYGDMGGGFQAFMWSSGSGIAALGTLGGANSYATAINNAGQVVGHAAMASGYEHAFVWSGGVMTDLGTLGGNSFAYGINQAGDVVGYSFMNNGVSHAFLERNGSMVDLNSLLDAGSGWELMTAYGINDAGQIVGTGMFQGQERVFRLDPTSSSIPEPGGAALAALGLGLLVLFRRRASVDQRRSPGFALAVHGAEDQSSGVQHMLRLEVLQRPSRARLEFNAQKKADFAENAVAHDPSQLALGVSDAQGRLEWYRTVQLQRSARQGNVFQMSQGTAGPSALVLPLQPDHVRAQHPGFNTPVEHMLVYRRSKPK